MSLNNNPTRWGILCTGRICQDFVSALAPFPDHRIVAVAGRKLESAKQFAADYGVEKAYGSYEELLKDPEIDIAYVGGIGPLHLPLSKLALENGKNVLCEKPLCVNAKEVRELVELARKKKLFLMEGVWSRFFPSYIQLEEELRKGTAGDVKQVLITFSLPLGDRDRTGLKEVGRSSLMDIGTYCVQFASLVFGKEKPLKVVSAGHLNDGGVDESTSTTLLYSGGRTATFITHYGVDLPSDAYAFGTKGTLKLTSFWASKRLETPHGVMEFKDPETTKTFNFSNSVGLSWQCHEIRRCIQNGETESPRMSLDESILIAEIMDSIREQVGVVFSQDKAN